MKYQCEEAFLISCINSSISMGQGAQRLPKAKGQGPPIPSLHHQGVSPVGKKAGAGEGVKSTCSYQHIGVQVSVQRKISRLSVRAPCFQILELLRVFSDCLVFQQQTFLLCIG